MPPPRLELTGAVDSRRSLDERSVRPSPPACALPPFGPLCPRSLAHQGFSSHRHAVWLSPPPAPEAEKTENRLRGHTRRPRRRPLNPHRRAPRGLRRHLTEGPDGHRETSSGPGPRPRGTGGPSSPDHRRRYGPPVAGRRGGARARRARGPALQPRQGAVRRARRDQARPRRLLRARPRAAAADDGRAPGAHAALPATARADRRSSRSASRRTRPSGCETTTVTTVNGTPSRALVIADLAHVVWAVNLGCLGFHVWPYRAADPEHCDELRLDLDPQPGTDFTTCAARPRRAQGAARRARHRRLPEDHGQPRPARLRPPASRAGTPTRCAPPRSRSPASSSAAAPTSSRRRGGRRSAASGSSSTTTRTPRTRRSSARGRCVPRRAARSRRRCAGRRSSSSHPDELTLATVPDRLDRLGDPWADIDDAPQSLEPLLAMHERDRANGLLDAPWPPVYPKMPDEPPRVAPSRARKQPSG